MALHQLHKVYSPFRRDSGIKHHLHKNKPSWLDKAEQLEMEEKAQEVANTEVALGSVLNASETK